jgi:hypothetical protein
MDHSYEADVAESPPCQAIDVLLVGCIYRKEAKCFNAKMSKQKYGQGLWTQISYFLGEHVNFAELEWGKLAHASVNTSHGRSSGTIIALYFSSAIERVDEMKNQKLPYYVQEQSCTDQICGIQL